MLNFQGIELPSVKACCRKHNGNFESAESFKYPVKLLQYPVACQWEALLMATMFNFLYESDVLAHFDPRLCLKLIMSNFPCFI